MTEEVEFKSQEELKKMLLQQYMDSYLKKTGLSVDMVALVEGKDDTGNVIYYFTEKKESK
jgi:hypothetical protein